MANDKKDLYVDGVLILEDATISSSSISSATHKVGKIRMFQLSTTSSGAVYLDNYKFSSFDTSGNESLLLSIDFEDETVYPNNKVYTSNTANTTACPIYFYGSSTQTYTLHRLGKHMEITYDGKNSPYADIINATEAGKNISVEFELSFGPEVLCCELGDLIQLVDSNKNETTLLKLKSDSIEDGIINYLCDPANNASVGSAFSAGDKVSVKIICDFKNQTKDIYLNDTLVVSDTALENASESFAAVATRIGDLGSSATGTLHINNYKLSYVS